MKNFLFNSNPNRVIWFLSLVFVMFVCVCVCWWMKWVLENFKKFLWKKLKRTSEVKKISRLRIRHRSSSLTPSPTTTSSSLSSFKLAFDSGTRIHCAIVSRCKTIFFSIIFLSHYCFVPILSSLSHSRIFSGSGLSEKFLRSLLKTNAHFIRFVCFVSTLISKMCIQRWIQSVFVLRSYASLNEFLSSHLRNCWKKLVPNTQKQLLFFAGSQNIAI